MKRILLPSFGFDRRKSNSYLHQRFNVFNFVFMPLQEIATSPEKLEKLAAANPPPSTEVVAAE